MIHRKFSTFQIIITVTRAICQKIGSCKNSLHLTFKSISIIFISAIDGNQLFIIFISCFQIVYIALNFKIVHKVKCLT